MDDNQIINLFFQRDEDAIKAVDDKYGARLNALAANMMWISGIKRTIM
ncbi:MAG: hypothetical protein Q4E78_00345 [Eubacteriales bacterium]|nr:hypothetical protein [Eubacteriales bacterium]